MEIPRQRYGWSVKDSTIHTTGKLAASFLLVTFIEAGKVKLLEAWLDSRPGTDGEEVEATS